MSVYARLSVAFIMRNEQSEAENLMGQAIHLICKKEVSGQPTNVRHDPISKTFKSGFWDISDEEAQSLIGGWLYLHTTKSEPSYFGGEVIGYTHEIRTDVARQDRIDLHFRPSWKAKGQSWRGHDHPRAWTSGLVDANFAHEAKS